MKLENFEDGSIDFEEVKELQTIMADIDISISKALAGIDGKDNY